MPPTRRATDTPISLPASALTAKRTNGKCASAARTSPARWPTTTKTSATPAPRRLATHASTTLLPPNGSSGLDAPMRSDRPAARQTAEQEGLMRRGDGGTEGRGEREPVFPPVPPSPSPPVFSSARIRRTCFQLLEGAQHEGAGHLLAVVHQVIRVVERSRSQVTRLRRRAHALLFEPMADERLRRRLDFERRGSDAAEHDARAHDRPAFFNVEPRSDA